VIEDQCAAESRWGRAQFLILSETRGWFGPYWLGVPTLPAGHPMALLNPTGGKRRTVSVIG